MTADLQMVRGAVVGGHNLAIGEPEFLHKPMFDLWYKSATASHGDWAFYPEIGGHPHLVQLLQELYPKYKYVVVANGAKQALLAAFYAYKNVRHHDHVHHAAPYWPSYPTLARLVGMDFSIQEGTHCGVRCVTSPNNPDGWTSINPCAVWDAVYAHAVYGWSGQEPTHAVRVGGAAKILGLAGARVGWLLTNDADIFRFAAQYVELTTSGVAGETQNRVSCVLQRAMGPEGDRAYREARATLLRNGELFQEYLGEHCAAYYGVPANGKGMFAWFLAKDPAKFDEAKALARVVLVDGHSCGIEDDGWWRMSMGLENDETEAALKALWTELKK